MKRSISVFDKSLRIPYRMLMVTGLLLVVAASHEARAEDIVVIVNTTSSASSMTADEISQIYLGKSTTMRPVDNGDKSVVRTQFYTKVAGKNESQVKAIWARLVFSGRGSMPQELASNADVVKAVATDPRAIGYIDKSAVNSSVKVVLEVK